MRVIIAETITIGDEILFGQTLDTNSHWICGVLSSIGIRVLHKTTVSDNKAEISLALYTAQNRADLIIMTGGLGPTKDDITKKTINDFFGSQLIINENVLTHIKNMLEKRGRELNDLNKMQALVPECAEVLHNQLGTAPGMWIQHKGKIFISLPGVPHETKRIMTDNGFEKIKAFFNPPVIFHKKIKVIGIPESTLSLLIETWEDALPAHIKLAYLPNLNKITLRLTGTGENLIDLQNEVNEQAKNLIPYIEKFIYGYDEEEFEENIGKWLKEKGKTIATAESCTGGSIAQLLTSVSGSSAYFKGSVVAYTNDVKHKVLKVSQLILDEFSAVSEPTVKSMAIGIRELLGTDYGIATTGIAGPDGGTTETPVGTIWIALAFDGGCYAKKLELTKDRNINIQYTTLAALDLLRSKLLAL